MAVLAIIELCSTEQALWSNCSMVYTQVPFACIWPISLECFPSHVFSKRPLNVVFAPGSITYSGGSLHELTIHCMKTCLPCPLYTLPHPSYTSAL